MGDWDGSTVIEDHISFLRDMRRMPNVAFVKARVPPEVEISPVPQEGERVVFRSHFLRGFGLPVSGFFRSFLDFYHLQPHHLTPNAVTLLSTFVTACEGYIGILPTIMLWGVFFYGKLGTSARETAAECGGFVAVHRPAKRNAFPVIKLAQSVKMWQQSYFYIENVDPAADFLNLPAYEAAPHRSLRLLEVQAKAGVGGCCGRHRPTPGAPGVEGPRGLRPPDHLRQPPGAPAPEPPSSNLPDERAPRPQPAVHEADADC